MKYTTLLLAFFCWHSISSAQDSSFVWGLQVSTFPGSQPEEENFSFSAITTNSPSTGSADFAQQNPLLHCADPGLFVSWENPRTFHNLVFNPRSLTFTNLNIVIGKHLDYHCFFSYSPKENIWFFSTGASKSFEIKGGGEITPYAEWGCENFDSKSWLIEVGVVYTLELGPIQFKHRNKNNNKRRDHP